MQVHRHIGGLDNTLYEDGPVWPVLLVTTPGARPYCMYVLYMYVSFVIVSSPGQPQVYPSIHTYSHTYIRVYAFNPFIFTTEFNINQSFSSMARKRADFPGNTKVWILSPLSTPFFWWRVIFSLSPGTNTSAYVLRMVSQASHSIQFNPSTTVNCGPADGN